MYYKDQNTDELPSHRGARKRFKRYCQFFGVGVSLSTLTFLITNDQELFEKTTIILGFSAGIWMIVDDKTLAIRPYYLKCLLVALLFAFYALSMEYFTGGFTDTFTYASAICLLTLLAVQWPVRIIYLITFKREPKADRYGKFADTIYALILLAGLIFLPLLISTYLF